MLELRSEHSQLPRRNLELAGHLFRPPSSRLELIHSPHLQSCPWWARHVDRIAQHRGFCAWLLPLITVHSGHTVHPSFLTQVLSDVFCLFPQQLVEVWVISTLGPSRVTLSCEPWFWSSRDTGLLGWGHSVCCAVLQVCQKPETYESPHDLSTS